MGKNNSAPGLQSKDSFQRMNYLYQASKLLANSHGGNQKLSTFYSDLMINVAKKCVLRIDQNIKRNICKGCHGILLPGNTAHIRYIHKPNKYIKWTCLKCRTLKRFNVTKQEYKTWSETSEACISIIDLKQNNKSEGISETTEKKRSDNKNGSNQDEKQEICINNV